MSMGAWEQVALTALTLVTELPSQAPLPILLLELSAKELLLQARPSSRTLMQRLPAAVEILISRLGSIDRQKPNVIEWLWWLCGVTI